MLRATSFIIKMAHHTSLLSTVHYGNKLSQTYLPLMFNDRCNCVFIIDKVLGLNCVGTMMIALHCSASR